MALKDSAPSILEVHLLGPFRLLVDGREVEGRQWTRRKPALLVKLLALQPHHQLHREQVMELLWPELDAEAATNNLHKSIHIARRALEPALRSRSDSHFILTYGQQVSLRAPTKLWIDVEAFEQAAAEALRASNTQAYEKALALYEGDLLIEDPYQDWIAARREHLRALRSDLLVKLSRLYEDQGRHQHGILKLKEILALDPANEDAHRHLMRLYIVTGNRQQALHQYEQCREVLLRELDARPGPATVMLYEQIAAGEIRPLTSDEFQGPRKPDQITESIAILPLTSSSTDPNLEYLCGISENIINNLSQLPRLRVMACSTVGRYKGREVNPQEVGRDLNVRTVMTGKVLQLRDTLIIRTELVDVATGVQLWGEQYSRKLSDILALEEVISRDISEKLLIKLTADEQVRLHRRQTSNPEAYQLFLKGRYFWNKRTEEGLKKSIEYFQRAIEKDPGYAAAYAGMSDCYILLVGEHGLPAQEGLTKAKTAAMKALEIDGTLADAHTSLAHAMLHNWEWAEAEIELKRAIELDAEDPVARQVYYEYLSATGRVEEALIEMKKAQEIDPLSLAINSNVAAALYFARQYDRAIEQCQKILEMDPTFYWANWNLGRVYEQKGMFAEAIAELAKAVEMSRGNAHLLASLGYAYAVAGRIQDAQDVLSVLIGMSEPNPASPYDIAMIYVGLGENDRAFEWLERAYRERDGMMTHLKVTPRIDPLRSDPRFEDLMRRIGLI